MVKDQKFKYIVIELAGHFPYSISGVTMGLILMGFLTFFAILVQAEHLLPVASEKLFHLFHPAHVLLSAVATTAMFWKHEKVVFKAIIVGLLGSITICGISDILFPFCGGILLGKKMAVHICILQEPMLVIPFAIFGVFAGFFISKAIDHSTEYSHSAHVLVSSMASILYLTAYGLQDWIHLAGGVFTVTIFAVMIPCCASDIAFPLFCTHKHCQHD